MICKKKKKIILISIGVVFVLSLCFLAYKSYNIKNNMVNVEGVDFKEMYDISLNGDVIAVILENDLKSDKYTFRFLSKKEGNNSNNIYVLKEDIENIDVSSIASTYDYYKKIEYPLANYLIDVYLKNIMKIENEDTIKNMNISCNSIEKEDKTSVTMEIKSKNEETFKYNIDFEDNFVIKISY